MRSQLDPDVVIVSLDVDPNETDAMLKRYAEDHEFDWIFARAPQVLLRELVRLGGNNVLNPPSVPKFLLDKDQNLRQLPFGIQTGEAILKELNSGN